MTKDLQIELRDQWKMRGYKEGGQRLTSHPLKKSTSCFGEYRFTPFSSSGVVVPCAKSLNHGGTSDFKLVCSSGLEYFIRADSGWRDVLSRHLWEEVKMIGLLNVFDKTIIPQKIFPKGCMGQEKNVIDLATWKSRDFLRKTMKIVNDFLFIPAALYAVMASTG